jgi:uncharacterized protein YciI
MPPRRKPSRTFFRSVTAEAMTGPIGILVMSIVAAMLIAFSGFTVAQQVDKRRQYVYVLKLTPRMHLSSAWTDADNAVVGHHFARLQQATEAGLVILAGRTNEALDKTFGFVVFEADSDEAARLFMESDPVVTANIMSATLHPYSVALYRRQ